MKQIGKKLGDYLIEEHLGSGSFGDVYKVSKEDDSGKYFYAIKHICFPTVSAYNEILHSNNQNLEETDEYFKTLLKSVVSEYNNMRDLSSSNSKYFVNYYDHTISGTPRQYDILIRMELLTPLNKHLDTQTMTVRDVLNLGLQVAEGLAICHKKKIIHRDVKEANIFVNKEGDFKLGDFGVATTLEKTSQYMSRKGTPFYMAPEILLNKKYSFNVDIYALATMLYKLLNKQRYPYMPQYPKRYSGTDMDNAQMDKIKGAPLEAPLQAQNQLGEVLIKALATASQRFKTCEDFIAALQNAQKSLDDKYLDTVVSEPAKVVLEEQPSVFSQPEPEPEPLGERTADLDGDEVQTIGFSGENIFDMQTQKHKAVIDEPIPLEKVTLSHKTNLKAYNYVLPVCLFVLSAVIIDILARDIVFGYNFIDNAYFRLAALLLALSGAIFFVVKIIIFPDAGTYALSKYSKKWQKECLQLLNSLYKHCQDSVGVNVNSRGFKYLDTQLDALVVSMENCKSFWKMTPESRNYEDKIMDEIYVLDKLLRGVSFFDTMGSKLTNISDAQKSEFGTSINKIRRLIEQREANLQKGIF